MSDEREDKPETFFVGPKQDQEYTEAGYAQEQAARRQGYPYDSSEPATGFVGRRAEERKLVAENTAKLHAAQAERLQLEEPRVNPISIPDPSSGLSYSELKRMLLHEQERNGRLMQLLESANVRMAEMQPRSDSRLERIEFMHNAREERLRIQEEVRGLKGDLVVLNAVIEAARRSASVAVDRAERDHLPALTRIRRMIQSYLTGGIPT